MNEAQIYWLITLPKIANGAGAGLLTLGLCCSFFLVFLWVALGGEIEVKKYIKWSILMLVIGTLLTTFIPSTKELVAIYAIPKVVNNEQVQAIPEKLLELANLKLDDLIQETK